MLMVLSDARHFHNVPEQHVLSRCCVCGQVRLMGVGVVVLLPLAAAAAARWVEGIAARFVFVDYDEHHT
jgi:hypothetical protein